MTTNRFVDQSSWPARITEIATRVRRALEDAHDGFPHYACAEGAAVLAMALNRAGIDAVLIGGSFRLDREMPIAPNDPAEGSTLGFAHVWVSVGDQVVDVTGDQFNAGLVDEWPPVYIGPPADRYMASEVGVDLSDYEEAPLIRVVRRVLGLTRAG